MCAFFLPSAREGCGVWEGGGRGPTQRAAFDSGGAISSSSGSSSFGWGIQPSPRPSPLPAAAPGDASEERACARSAHHSVASFLFDSGSCRPRALLRRADAADRAELPRLGKSRSFATSNGTTDPANAA